MHKRTLLLALVVAACDASPLFGSGGDGPPVTALFAVPRDGRAAGDFYALPFPSDIRRTADGHPDLRGYPDIGPLLGLYVAAIGERLDGFGLNAAMHVRFSAEIDPASLPTPEGSLEPAAAVYLVDVDAASPRRGQRVPIRLRFEPRAGRSIGADWLGALPYPGFPLAEGTTYALVVTDRLRASGPVVADGDFAAIAAAAVPADPALAAAQAAYAPLWAWLDEPGGDERGDVVSAAVFTTQRATAIMGRLRAAVRALPAPAIRDVQRVDVPGEGIAVYDGVFDAPNFQRGVPPYDDPASGDIVEDGDQPRVQRMEPLRVSFSVPISAPPASGWPVAIYAHGTGGSYHSYLNDDTAARLAAQGIAMISIDQVLHGPRNPGGDPDLAFFNFQNPLAARDNAVQGAADDFSVVRLVEGLAYRDPAGGAPIRFDPDRIFFFGHSQGGLTGPPFIAYEPAVQGAVLSGAGGLLYYALLTKTEPVDITAIVAAVIRDRPLDEFNPILALLQTWVERSDTINYGPLLTREPPPGLTARPIFQSEGFVDHYTPLPTIEALATAIGGNQVEPVMQPIEGLALRGRDALTAPVAGNLDGATAVLLQYQAPPDADGHYVVFDVAAAQVQSARFLGTLATTGKATLVGVPPP